MKRKMKIVIAILMVIGVSSLFGVVFASRLEMFIFTVNLQVEEFKSIHDDSYAANIFDDGVRVQTFISVPNIPLPKLLMYQC